MQKRFPERVINVGIAEQDMVGIASGLANGGKIPFVCSAACFLTGRALEQIKVDLAYTRANVKIVRHEQRRGLWRAGADPSSIEDVAWLRAIAGMTVIAPADPLETAQAVRAAAQSCRAGLPAPEPHAGACRARRRLPLRDRQGGAPAPGQRCDADRQRRDGQPRARGGALCWRRDGVSARVLNMATVQPLDREAIVLAARETRGIVTVEEHSVRGGLGGAVAEVVVTTSPVPMRILGMPGVFCPTGSAEWLLEHFGLTPAGIAAAARGLLA